MGIYLHHAPSPYWWLRCARTGQKPICESTKIPWRAPTAAQRAVNKQLATDAYNARMGDLARDRYELPARDQDDADPVTLRTFLAWYDTNVVATHRGATREREIKQRFDKDLGPLAMAEVTLEKVTEWITARRKHLTGPKKKRRAICAASINREVRFLKAVLQSAASNKKIKASPIAGMPTLHELTPKRRYITPDDEAKILAAMGRADDQALFVMGLDTICRLGDRLDLRRSDDHGVRLWIADPKGGTGRWVPC